MLTFIDKNLHSFTIFEFLLNLIFVIMKNKFINRIYIILMTGMILVLSNSLKNSATILNAQETGSYTDPRDNKIYKTVKIGDQWIMAENFAYKPEQGGFWAYNNDTNNVAIYGYLYDWETANNIAPNGWHLPSKKEWKILRKSLGSRLDITSNIRKIYKQMVDLGESGFDALFGGAYVIAHQEFIGVGETAYFLSSTMTSNGPMHYIVNRMDSTAFIFGYADPKGGKSVRLFKD
jgi:uncharacterized protein (TIGR02145 family)